MGVCFFVLHEHTTLVERILSSWHCSKKKFALGTVVLSVGGTVVAQKFSYNGTCVLVFINKSSFSLAGSDTVATASITTLQQEAFPVCSCCRQVLLSHIPTLQRCLHPPTGIHHPLSVSLFVVFVITGKTPLSKLSSLTFLLS